MTDRSPVQGKILLGQLLLRTEGVCDFDAEHLLEVWGAGTTLGRFLATTEDLLAAARARLGQAPITAVLSDLSASSRAALSHMADFFNTPAGQAP